MQVSGVCANENKVYDCHWIFKIISKIFFWLFSFFETVWLGAILPDLSAGSQKGSTCHEALQGPFMQKWETCSDQ